MDAQNKILQSVEEEFSIYLWKKECSSALQSDSTLENSKDLLKSAEKYEAALRGEISFFWFYSNLLLFQLEMLFH